MKTTLIGLKQQARWAGSARTSAHGSVGPSGHAPAVAATTMPHALVHASPWLAQLAVALLRSALPTQLLLLLLLHGLTDKHLAMQMVACSLHCEAAS